MKTHFIRFIDGPNQFARRSVCYLEVSLGALQSAPSMVLGSEFVEGLKQSMPTLVNHKCGVGEHGGFFKRLTMGQGTYFGHIYEHVILEIQRLAGFNVRFGKTRTIGEPGSGDYYIVFRAVEEKFVRQAIPLAHGFLLSLMNESRQQDFRSDHLALCDLLNTEPLGAEFNTENYLSAINTLAQKGVRYRPGPSTQAILNAARRRHIPTTKVGIGSMWQLGHGSQAKYIQAAMTNLTSAMGLRVACDKRKTHMRLKAIGLPAPTQEIIRSEKDLLKAAENIPAPWVIKPLDGNHGRGVCLDINTIQNLQLAYEPARQESKSKLVVLEKFVAGDDYRLLVVGGRLVAAAHRKPPVVYGDGVSTIETLINDLNADPRRGVGHEKILTKVKIDRRLLTYLAKSGLTLDRVPAKGELVKLSDIANLSAGGTATDVTEILHPDNRWLAETAAKLLQLDIAGIDLIATDISQSFRTQNAAIVEVNAGPGLRMHLAPSDGPSQPVGEAIIDWLYPNQLTDARVPIIAIAGEYQASADDAFCDVNSQDVSSKEIQDFLHRSLENPNHAIGIVNDNTVTMAGQALCLENQSEFTKTMALLAQPDLTHLIIAHQAQEIAYRGLGYDQSDIAICLGVSKKHASDWARDYRYYARIMQAVIRAARHTVVLNGDCDITRKLVKYINAKNLVVVTTDKTLCQKDLSFKADIDAASFNVYWQVISQNIENRNAFFADAALLKTLELKQLKTSENASISLV